MMRRLGLLAAVLPASVGPWGPTAVLRAQEAGPHGAVPGQFVAQRCDAAPFPRQLPPVDSVLDTTSLAAALDSLGGRGRVVLGLRLGALVTTPRVRVIETKAPMQIAERVAHDVEAALGPAPTAANWAFRLRLDPDGDPRMRLERSRICGAAPPPPTVRREMAVVRGDDLERLLREAEENARRRRAMRHRVLVDSTGRVLGIELTNTSGDAAMDLNRTDALRRSRFEPTELDGVPVTAWIEIRGDHELERR